MTKAAGNAKPAPWSWVGKALTGRPPDKLPDFVQTFTRAYREFQEARASRSEGLRGRGVDLHGSAGACHAGQRQLRATRREALRLRPMQRFRPTRFRPTQLRPVPLGPTRLRPMELSPPAHGPAGLGPAGHGPTEPEAASLAAITASRKPPSPASPSTCARCTRWPTGTPRPCPARSWPRPPGSTRPSGARTCRTWAP